MVIKDLKELNKIMLLCRKNGVRSIKIDGVEFIMEDVTYTEPVKTHQLTNIHGLPETHLPGAAEANSVITSNMPTPEQLLFGSSDPSVWQDEHSSN